MTVNVWQYPRFFGFLVNHGQLERAMRRDTVGKENAQHAGKLIHEARIPVMLGTHDQRHCRASHGMPFHNPVTRTGRHRTDAVDQSVNVAAVRAIERGMKINVLEQTLQPIQVAQKAGAKRQSRHNRPMLPAVGYWWIHPR